MARPQQLWGRDGVAVMTQSWALEWVARDRLDPRVGCGSQQGCLGVLCWAGDTAKASNEPAWSGLNFTAAQGSS